MSAASLTVTPNTGLTTGQTVAVAGAGGATVAALLQIAASGEVQAAEPACQQILDGVPALAHRDLEERRGRSGLVLIVIGVAH